MEKKTWDEFRSTGLLLFINQFLHIFGWCIVVEYEGEEIINTYPARTKFRGFPEEANTKAYEKITKYMKNNCDELLKDVKE